MMALALRGRGAYCARPGCETYIGSTEPLDSLKRVRLDERVWHRTDGRPPTWKKGRKVRRHQVYEGAAGPMAIPGRLSGVVGPDEVVVCPRCGSHERAPVV